MNRIITVIVVCMAMISCSRGSVIVPWEQFQYVFDKDGRSVVELDPTKHRYMLYTTEANLRNILSHTPEGKIDKIISENPSWQFLIYCKMEPSDSLKLMQLLNKHNCSFPVILDPNGEFLSINKIEPTYTMIGYFCDKNGKVRGSSVIGTTQSFFDREFAYAKYDINSEISSKAKPQKSHRNKQFRLTFALLPNIGNFVKICNMKTTSVALGPYFEDFIKAQIAQGRYNNASEVIRAGLRLLEDNNIRIAALKSEIEEGLNSGEAVDFDPAAHLKSLKASKRNA